MFLVQIQKPSQRCLDISVVAFLDNLSEALLQFRRQIRKLNTGSHVAVVAQKVRRTPHAFQPLAENVRVDFGGLKVLVSQQFLDDANVIACFQ